MSCVRGTSLIIDCYPVKNGNDNCVFHLSKIQSLKNKKNESSEITEDINTLAVKTDGPCSVLTSLVTEGNNGLPQLVSDI